MTDRQLTLTVLRDQSTSLIRAEVRAADERKLLEQAVRDCFYKLGASVDEISAETGLSPDDVVRIVSEVPPLDDGDLLALAGLR